MIWGVMVKRVHTVVEYPRSVYGKSPEVVIGSASHLVERSPGCQLKSNRTPVVGQ